MSWETDHCDGSWWADDPDDGELLQHDGRWYHRVGYVFAGLSVDVAVAQHNFIPPHGSRYRMHLPDGCSVFFDPGDGEYGLVKNVVSRSCGSLFALEGAHVPAAEKIIQEKLDETDSSSDDSDSDDSTTDESSCEESDDDDGSDLDDHEIPRRGWRYRMSLACRTALFYDPGDGEWGFVVDGTCRTRGQLNDLLGAVVERAKTVIHRKLDWGVS